MSFSEDLYTLSRGKNKKKNRHYIAFRGIERNIDHQRKERLLVFMGNSTQSGQYPGRGGIDKKLLRLVMCGDLRVDTSCWEREGG